MHCISYISCIGRRITTSATLEAHTVGYCYHVDELWNVVLGIPWWPSVWDSVLSLQRMWVHSLVGELDLVKHKYKYNYCITFFVEENGTFHKFRGDIMMISYWNIHHSNIPNRRKPLTSESEGSMLLVIVLSGRFWLKLLLHTDGGGTCVQGERNWTSICPVSFSMNTVIWVL